ncbi:cobalt-precorrin-4/precorrin-4 C(11)-methyltransferase [Aquihabitans daechungensis]|uniref:cobalt-precorrin-4/precorrin-4 C(11)-methyltransferase n=1 Tax=Aquihabitans daechungensis TaxID=1052257 RepID=UPI003B9F5C7E
MISFVGAGPGAADLLTFRAADRLARADIVLWAGSLVSPEVLEHCRADVELLDTKGMTLEQVTDVFAAHPGAAIVRLHSGDPAWYSAIGEQITWCIAHGHPFEVVPGVSSVSAAAAALGAELTVPGVSQTVVLTRLAKRTAKSLGPGDDLAAQAAQGGLIALFLSAGDPGRLQDVLLGPGSAFTAATPVAIVHRVTWPDEQLVTTTLGNLATELTERGITMSALVLVGEALRPGPDACVDRSHVYDPAFATRFRDAAS